ncbi:MAG: hypothetical protein WA633_03670 [Stellaceae bacterium]
MREGVKAVAAGMNDDARRQLATAVLVSFNRLARTTVVAVDE